MIRRSTLLNHFGVALVFLMLASRCMVVHRSPLPLRDAEAADTAEKTVGDMEVLARLLELRKDEMTYARSLRAGATLDLVMPQDAWGNRVRYVPTESTCHNSCRYWLVSAGPDQVFESASLVVSPFPTPLGPSGDDLILAQDPRSPNGFVSNRDTFEPAMISAQKAQRTIEAVVALLEPIQRTFFEKDRLPTVAELQTSTDGWGAPLHYIVSKDLQHFRIVSGGADRTLEAGSSKLRSDSAGVDRYKSFDYQPFQLNYPIGPRVWASRLEHDIIYEDGHWEQLPSEDLMLWISQALIQKAFEEQAVTDEGRFVSYRKTGKSRHEKEKTTLVSMGRFLQQIDRAFGELYPWCSRTPTSIGALEKDSWNNPFRYVTDGDRLNYRLVSAGSDGLFSDSSLEIALSWRVLETDAPGDDIIIQNGELIQYPRSLSGYVTSTKMKVLESEFDTLGYALSSYYGAHDRVPDGQKLEDLRGPLIGRIHQRSIPRTDPWGAPFAYRASAQGDDYRIVSGGSDGEISEASLDLSHPFTQVVFTKDTAADLIFESGRFVKRPQTFWQKSRELYTTICRDEICSEGPEVSVEVSFDEQ